MLHTRIFGSVVTAAFAVALPLAAQQTNTIDFHEYASDTLTSYQAAIGDPVSSHGLDFYQASGFQSSGTSNNMLATWGTNDAGAVNRPSNIGSSTALWGTTLGAEIDVFNHDSDPIAGTFYAPFSIFSMDVSHLYSSAYSPIAIQPFNLTFYGFAANTFEQVSQTFFIPASPIFGGVRTPMLHTLVFNDDFQNIVELAWLQGPGSGTAHQFTNVVSSTPEPSSMALVGTGLVGLFGVTGRRRRGKSSKTA